MVSYAADFDNLNQVGLRYIEGWELSDSIDESLGKSAKQGLWPFSDPETVQAGHSQNHQLPFGLGTLDSSILEPGFVGIQLPESPESVAPVEIAPWSAIGCFSP
jgi:hypothetical protein